MLGLVLYGLQARAEGWGASEINSFQDGRTLYYVRPHNGLSCRASWVSDSLLTLLSLQYDDCVSAAARDVRQRAA